MDPLPDRLPLVIGVTGHRDLRDQDLRAQLLSDPHSPNEFRANGVVSNLPEYYAAFGVKPGDKLFRAPDQRVKIW